LSKLRNLIWLAPLLAASCREHASPASAASAATPGVDTASIDRSISPGDDLYGYGNGGWEKATPIPADRATYGAFSIVDDEVSKRNVALIQGAGKSGAAAGSDADMVGSYYDAYMDEASIEKRGLEPVQEELAAIRGIADRAALARVLGSELRADVDALNATNFHTDRLYGLWIAPGFDDPERFMPYLMQGGLGMPDRDDYRNTDPKAVELQGKYREHIAAILRLAQIDDADAKAARIYDLEKRIADTHVSRTDSLDVHKANNPWPVTEFPKRAPGLDWKSYFEAAGLTGPSTVIVWHPSAVTGIASLVGKQPLDVWKEYLTFHVLDRSAYLLPKGFADENFRFYGTTLTGALKQRERWERAVRATSGALPDPVGKLYVEKYFPAEAKAQAQEMVKNIVAAFGRRIDKLEWMSAATREKAKAKVQTLYVGIGYPEKWRDFSGLKIVKDDPLGNAQRSELFDYRANLAKLGKPVDKSEWAMSPQTVNAVNLPLQNALNFPAAILNPPFYYPGGDPVRNYGAIGTVIGHEISHSFDDQGSQFDAQGRLANWWTPEDLAHFNEAAARLVAQYDAYEPLPGMHINGKLTLSENIADVAGLSAAYDGYRSAYPQANAATLDGFSADQRFFIGFAQIWKDKSRPEALRVRLMTDGHSPGPYRADTARNTDAWYAAFDVKAGEKLYLAPDARVRVW
jgi:putative endopeptidase